MHPRHTGVLLQHAGSAKEVYQTMPLNQLADVTKGPVFCCVAALSPFKFATPQPLDPPPYHQHVNAMHNNWFY